MERVDNGEEKLMDEVLMILRGNLWQSCHRINQPLCKLLRALLIIYTGAGGLEENDEIVKNLRGVLKQKDLFAL